jgi:hypothetical protein
MRCNNLIGTCFLFGALIANGVFSSVQADDSGFVRLTPAELKWVPSNSGFGVESAILYGDPKKAGEFYIVQVKFPPNVFDYPHSHPENRHVTVIKGTWYTVTCP